MGVLDRLFGSDDRVGGYAAAAVAVAQAEGALGTIEDELFAFAKAVDANAQLREAIGNRALPVENRVELVRDVLGERAHPTTVALVSFLIQADRARDLTKIAERVTQIAAEQRQREVAEVRSAVPLSDAQRARLTEALSRATGKQVEVKIVVDPTVVGGVVARVGDEVFDGSVASRLEDATQVLGS
ncbi:MAG TPA: ATP synthase F1 subunit delta [Actinomycetota bacterium]|nr:ATP synthase F1 subunit delta [Actinomycetota bacterium]